MSKRSRFSYRQDDLDWKPEMPEPVREKSIEPVQPATEFPGGRYPTPGTAPGPFSNSQLYKGLLTIVELEYNPPRFILILDKDKELMRFPFGGMEATDISPAAGAARETREEIGVTEDVGTPIRDDGESFIGEVHFGNSVYYVFTKKVSVSTRVTLGPEQEEDGWAPATADEIDQFARDGMLTFKHARCWEVFKQKRRP